MPSSAEFVSASKKSLPKVVVLQRTAEQVVVCVLAVLELIVLLTVQGQVVVVLQVRGDPLIDQVQDGRRFNPFNPSNATKSKFVK